MRRNSVTNVINSMRSYSIYIKQTLCPSRLSSTNCIRSAATVLRIGRALPVALRIQSSALSSVVRTAEQSRGVPGRARDRAAGGRRHGREEAEIFKALGYAAVEQAHPAPLRQDVMDFVQFLGLRWPDESTRLFTVSIAEVQAFRDEMLAEAKAPKTINRRIASLSSFYKYLQGVASEFRLPITVPNPAHAQFIPRGSSDPRDETKAFPATRARQLMGLPSGDTVFDYRDRAVVEFFLYSGARSGPPVVSG